MSDKNSSLKCSQQVRNIPLERYRLPGDGRKWRQAACSRSALLLRLSTYSNGDGTFVRNGRNYSPSLKTLMNHIGHGSYYRLADALRATGLLSWVREKHYESRIYTIHLSEISGPTFNPEQVPDSEKTGPTFDNESSEQVPHSQNQVPHSTITGPTFETLKIHNSKQNQAFDSVSENHPSCPSKAPSGAKEEREPSSDEKPNLSPSLPSPAAAETKGSGHKTSGQEKIGDLDRIVGFCFELTGKAPNPKHIDAFLQRFSTSDIMCAFRDYVDQLNEKDLPWAEKTFFADGGGVGIILACRQKEWKDNLENVSDHAEQDDSVDDFLAQNPVPAGVTDCDVLIKQARKRRAQVDQKWNAENPPCVKCGDQGTGAVAGGLCKTCAADQSKPTTCPRCGGHDLVHIKGRNWNCMSPECVRRRQNAANAA